MRISDKYRFFLSVPGTGPVQVFPFNKSLDWATTRISPAIARKELETKLIFRDSGDVQDFTKIYTVERMGDRCQRLMLTVEKNCADVWSLHWVGYISVVDCEFNVDACEVVVKPRVYDDYTKIYDVWEKEFNVLDEFGNVTLSGFAGNLVFRECVKEGDRSVVGDAIDPAVCIATGHSSWSPIEHDATWDPVTDYVTKRTLFVREESLTQPADSGWEFVVDRWVRPVVTVQTQYFDLTIEVKIRWRVDDIDVDNGSYLNDVIEWLFGMYGFTVISNFLNINPDGTQPNNDPYTASNDAMHETVIFQKSDIARADAAQNATVLNMTIKQVLEELQNNCEVYWNSSNGVVRIEHVSYFSATNSLNLTEPDLVHSIKGRWQYTYNKERLPEKEVYKWKEESDKDGDFDGVPIIYRAECSNIGQEKTVTSDWETNVQYIIKNTADDVSTSELQGTVWVATRANAIIHEVGALTGSVHLNGHLSRANLMNNYLRWNRPQKSGTMNNTETVFYRPIRSRIQKDITIRICCNDMQQFDPLDQVKTQLGWGQIEKSTYSEPSMELTLELAFE